MNQNHTAILILAWPEVTARSEDAIMKLLRKVNVVKNLNVRVGHAAMIVVDGAQMRYYDFGRYITPKYMGRVRSALTDPALQIDTQAIWHNNQLQNLEDICIELAEKSAYTHGEGLLQMAVFQEVNVKEVEQFALAQQRKGLIPYRTFDKQSTNCARFVQTAVLAGLHPDKKHHRRFKRPVTYNAPTPYFNVLASAQKHNPYYEWKHGKGEWKYKPIFYAWWDITTNVFASMSKSKTQAFSEDSIVGRLIQREPKPSHLPDDALYLGGIGEAAWYHVSIKDDNTLFCTRWFLNGELDFEAYFQATNPMIQALQNKEYQLSYDSHFAWLTFQSSDHKTFRVLKK